jgi:hypothetical protein
MKDIDDAALDELGLQDGRSHPEDRLVRKERRALGHRMNGSGESDRRQAIEKRARERA